MSKVFIYGIGGGSGGPGKQEETKTVDLSMTRGDQVILPSTDKVLSKVTITKPSSMMAENIKKGVSIAGVAGTYEAGGTTLPVLNAVSIARAGAILNITNPSTNGNFTKGYKIYSNSALAAEITATSFELKTLDEGMHSVMVRAKGNNFSDSPNSNAFSCSVYSISSKLIGLTTSNQDERISDALEYKTTIKAIVGKFLPEFLTIAMGGIAPGYTYDSYSGLLTIPNANGNIRVTAVAYDIPKLRTPNITLNEFTLEVDSVRYARTYSLYVDNEVVKTYTEYADFEAVDVEGAQYGFAQNANGYYESTNQKKGSTYAICRINLSLSSPRTVNLNCISYGESNYDFGILSNIDTSLTLSVAEDPTANVKKNFKGLSSTNVQVVSYEVEAGDHFIYAKYRKDGSGDSGNDSLQFTVEFI